MKTFYKKKYGEYVSNILINDNLEILRNNVSKLEENHQSEIIAHLKYLTKSNGEKLINPALLENKKIGWGFDCSGWLGSLVEGKDILIIGTEPNVDKDFKIAYDFGHEKNKTLEQVAIKQYNYKYSRKYRTRDISKILTEIFYNNPSNTQITNLLGSIYMTDMCFFAPKNAGNGEVIYDKLNIEPKYWSKLRDHVADKFLIEEINHVKPKIIISSSKNPANFLETRLGIEYKYDKLINSKLSVGTTTWKGIKMLSIPHLSGQTRNKLYRKSDQSSFEHAKEIIRAFLN